MDASENLRLLKKRFRFLSFLGFNVHTVARGRPTLDTGIVYDQEEGL